MGEVKIKYYYFQECVDCGFRYTLEPQSIGTHEVSLFKRDEKCPNCQSEKWVVDIKVVKQEIHNER